MDLKPAIAYAKKEITFQAIESDFACLEETHWGHVSTAIYTRHKELGDILQTLGARIHYKGREVMENGPELWVFMFEGRISELFAQIRSASPYVNLLCTPVK